VRDQQALDNRQLTEGVMLLFNNQYQYLSRLFHDKDLNDISFLVTGGAGFIGSHISEYLLRNGAKKVRVIDNFANGFQSNLEILNQYPAFEFFEGDIRNMEFCRRACVGIDYVSHQAALGSVPRSILAPEITNDVNAGGFVNMMKAAVDAGVKRFVFASSSSVYGDELSLPKKEGKTGNCLSPYAVSKRVNEMYAGVFSNVYKIDTVGFRYFNVFGPRQDPDGPYAAVIPLIIKSILKDSVFYINGDGEQTRDFTFVQDAVQANIRAMMCDNPAAMNKVYNVAAGSSYSVKYVYDAVKKYLGSSKEPVYREPRAGDVRNSLADISLAQELLGYVPTKKFDDGLIDTIEYFKKIQHS
jgi:UDP-N-acetylglucosamine 4-epimerase